MRERREWMAARGFALVACPGMPNGLLAQGFDPGKTYQFMREEWDEPRTTRLRDFHPMMNIVGLRYRELTGAPKPDTDR